MVDARFSIVEILCEVILRLIDSKEVTLTDVRLFTKKKGAVGATRGILCIDGDVALREVSDL